MSVSPWAVKSEMQAPSDLGGEWFISERVCVSTGTRVEFRSTRVEAPTKAVGFGAARDTGKLASRLTAMVVFVSVNVEHAVHLMFFTVEHGGARRAQGSSGLGATTRRGSKEARRVRGVPGVLPGRGASAESPGRRRAGARKGWAASGAAEQRLLRELRRRCAAAAFGRDVDGRRGGGE